MNISTIVMILSLGLFGAGVVTENVWFFVCGFIGGLGAFFYEKFLGGN